MGNRAICEFGRSDREIVGLFDAAELVSAIRQRIEEGKSKAEIGAGVDTQAAAESVTATFSAIKLAARGGASPQTLRNIARMSMRSLKYCRRLDQSGIGQNFWTSLSIKKGERASRIRGSA